MCGPSSRIHTQQECKGLSRGSMDAARAPSLFRRCVFCGWLGHACFTGVPVESHPREHNTDRATELHLERGYLVLSGTGLGFGAGKLG